MLTFIKSALFTECEEKIFRLNASSVFFCMEESYELIGLYCKNFGYTEILICAKFSVVYIVAACDF